MSREHSETFELGREGSLVILEVSGHDSVMIWFDQIIQNRSGKAKEKGIQIVNFDLNQSIKLLNIKLFIGDFCKIGRISRLSGDRELTFEIGSLPVISGGLEHMQRG